MTSKRQAIDLLIRSAGDTPMIFTTGYTCRIARSVGHRSQNLYMTGSMGLAAPIGVGLASVRRGPVIVVDGDGSLLMNVSVLCCVGARPELPLTHVVLDDGQYESTGGQPTGSASHDLIGLAVAAGYRTAMGVTDPDEFADTIRRRCGEGEGSMFAHWRLSPVVGDPGPRIEDGLRELAATFRRAIRTDEWPPEPQPARCKGLRQAERS